MTIDQSSVQLLCFRAADVVLRISLLRNLVDVLVDGNAIGPTVTQVRSRNWNINGPGSMPLKLILK